MGEAIRTIGVTPFTYYRWRKEFGGLKSDQVKRLKDLEKENERLRNAVSDLTLDRECLCIRIDRKLRSTDVIDVLSDLFILHGVPGHIRSDNAPEFVAKAVRD